MQKRKPSKRRYEEMGFESKTVKDKSGKLKYLTVCLRCSTELTTTSISRMEQHRACCNGIKKNPGKTYEGQNIVYSDTENKLGRHLSKMYNQLGFKPGRMIDKKGRYKCVALCLVCHNDIRNTSQSRLVGHRKSCNSDEYPPLEKLEGAKIEDPFLKDNINVIKEENSLISDKSIKDSSLEQKEIAKPSLQYGLSFGKFCRQLGFKSACFKTKSGLVQNAAICSVCHLKVLHMTRPRLLAHRRNCCSRKRLGRKPGTLYHVLGFKPLKVKTESGAVRIVAFCLVCEREIKNTTCQRLIAHRRVCKSVEYEMSHLSPTKINTQNSYEIIYIPSDEKSENPDNPTELIQILEEGNVEKPIRTKVPGKIGRNCSVLYEQLGYQPGKLITKSGHTKTVATCLVCNVEIRNTSSKRLEAHRRVCKSEKYNNFPTEEILIETVDYISDEENESFVENEADESKYSEIIFESTETAITSSNEEGLSNKLEYVQESSLKNKNNILALNSDLKLIDVCSMTDVKEAIANFIYGCSLPLSITESIHFQRLINTLDATCLTDIPKKQELSNDILTKTYKSHLEKAKSNWQFKDGALILDTIESNCGHKFLVSVLQDGITGARAFVNCLEVRTNLDDDDLFNEMVTGSVELAKFLYNTDIYAIVTDKIIRNENPENFNNVWYITCQKYLASLLLKDLLATLDFKTCLFKVNIIVDRLKQAELEKTLVYRKTNLGPDIDNLYFLTENWESFEKTAIILSEHKNFSSDIRLAFFDSDFKNICMKCVEKIDFLNGFIKKLSSRTCSLSDSLVLWQNFLKDPRLHDTSNLFNLLALDRVKETKNIYSLIAHYFGEGRNSDFSSVEHQKITDFLRIVLSKEGFKEYQSFKNKEVPCILDRDCYYRSVDFWKVLKKDLPNFASFALQVLRIPGSTGELQEVFKGFSKNCDDLSKEQLRKLMSVYFSLSIKEVVENV